jgi:diguanylate cyclase (GGDEF)-like protein
MIDTQASTFGPDADLARRLAAAVESGDAPLTGLLLQALDGLELLVSVKDMTSGRYLHANERMAALFDSTPQAMVGTLDTDFIDSAQAAALRSAELTAAGQALPLAGEQRIERGGRRREFRALRYALARADGAAPRYLFSMWTETTQTRLRDAQLKTALAQLEQQQVAMEQLRRETQEAGLRDSATGLYQHAHFEDQLRREIDLSSREHREFALVKIALDAPSDTVASLGAEARTRVLEALGRLLRGNTRAMDASCRLDEDHFAVLLSGVGLATAHSRVEGLRRQCATQIVVLNGQDIGFTVAMGVASFPHTALSQEDLKHAVDQALAEALRRGGNHVTLASIKFELG